MVTLKELTTGRQYLTHHDRLSNPLLFGKEKESREIESDANIWENAKEQEVDQLPVNKPERALIRTYVGRAVKPLKNPNFSYSFRLPSFISAYTSRVVTSTITHVSMHCLVSFNTTSTLSKCVPFHTRIRFVFSKVISWSLLANEHISTRHCNRRPPRLQRLYSLARCVNRCLWCPQLPV